VAALKETFKVENVAPGHCTGEPTFAALKRAFGDHYIYAGLGTSISFGPSTGERRGELRPGLDRNDIASYRKLSRREDGFGMVQTRRQR
jgi:7,8-dihydropterin-6-yl-methyl-4-(beta-D-ribofuranosyl)aminobenzene 5'-phosphate synthase